MSARSEAIARGLKTYKSDRLCKSGHDSERSVKTGTCLECTRLAALAWMKRNPQKMSAYTAAYRERNKEVVLLKDRELKRRLRKEQPEKIKHTNAKAYAKKVLETQGREVLRANRIEVSEVIKRLQEAHAGQIQYLHGYESMTSDAWFLCVQHGVEFQAHPHNVLRGSNGCSKCNHMKSRGEEEIFRFLSIFCHTEQRTRQVIKPKELDIYVPPGLAVEYCGEYFHSVKSKQDAENRHFVKYKRCQELGIRLLTIYESEWQQRKSAIKRLLRHAVGKGKGSLMARKCDLKRVLPHEAKDFYEAYHPQGGQGSGEHYGLYWKNKLVACMRFSFGANDRGQAERVWTLTRYATRIQVAGGASRLFNAFLQEHQPSLVKSFSDNRYFSGGMYEQLGFKLEQELKPDYAVYHPALGLLPKTSYQRKNIQKRLDQLKIDHVYGHQTDPRSESEMIKFMGAGKLYDCGKKKWVWRIDTPSST